ncbi:MAG: Kinase-like protein [Aureobasidium pullulans]|nr:MAG: Kinase-like protein [Aureobasidium pullulans]
MSTEKAPIKGVLLVGSVPGTDTEDVLRRMAPALGSRLKYIPDGETGQRNYFIGWQMYKFGAFPEVVSQFGQNGKFEDTPVPEGKIKEAAEKLEGMDTDYDTAAIESWPVFKKLKEEGVVPKHVKFQVCLPSPLTFVSPFIVGDYKTAIEPVYERAILRALDNIIKTVPKEELAIQWDVPIEFALLEGVWVQPWFSDVKQGILDRWLRLTAAVDSAVDMGFHFCYGDIGHQHFTQPKDTGFMADMAKELLSNVSRRVDYIHLPVPKDREDAAYFAPLKDLQAVRGETDIYLGLVHTDDLEGTQRRIKAASEVLDGFGVGTECGWGRTSHEEITSIVQISNAVSGEII